MSEKKVNLFITGPEGEIYKIPFEELKKFRITEKEKLEYFKKANFYGAMCDCKDEPPEWPDD